MLVNRKRKNSCSDGEVEMAEKVTPDQSALNDEQNGMFLSVVEFRSLHENVVITQKWSCKNFVKYQSSLHASDCKGRPLNKTLTEYITFRLFLTQHQDDYRRSPTSHMSFLLKCTFCTSKKLNGGLLEGLTLLSIPESSSLVPHVHSFYNCKRANTSGVVSNKCLDFGSSTLSDPS